MTPPINDAHCHFFSTRFFEALAHRQPPLTATETCAVLGWDDPGSPEALADRWIEELDGHGVSRAALIGSVPGDEDSVATAISRHPARFVGFFMLDPSAPDAVPRARRALSTLGLRGICLFPAMHGVALDDERTRRVAAVAAEHAGTSLFVHCGALSVGVRQKLGLPSRFDLRLGDPLALHALAVDFPRVPFIVPHFGAGRLHETLMVADRCSNVYLDTSSSNRWIHYTPGLTLEAVFRAALSVTGPSRLLFGTDSSFFPRGWQPSILDVQQRVLDAVGVGSHERAAILGGNFDRLFPTT